MKISKIYFTTFLNFTTDCNWQQVVYNYGMDWCSLHVWKVYSDINCCWQCL